MERLKTMTYTEFIKYAETKGIYIEEITEDQVILKETGPADYWYPWDVFPVAIDETVQLVSYGDNYYDTPASYISFKEAIEQNQKIILIKEIRMQTGWSLKNAYDFVRKNYFGIDPN